MDAVWPDTVVTDDSLVQCLMEYPAGAGRGAGSFHTARGRGYRLRRPGSRRDRAGRADWDFCPVEPALPAATVVARRHGRLWLAAAFVAIAIAAGAFLWLRPGPMPRDTGEARLHAGRRRPRSRAADPRVAGARGHRLRTRDRPRPAARARARRPVRRVHAARRLRRRPSRRHLSARAPAPRSGRSRSIPCSPPPTSRWGMCACNGTATGAALSSYRRALALDPNAPRARGLYAILLVSHNRVDEGLREARAALALQPDAPWTNTTMIIVLYLGGLAEESDRAGPRRQPSRAGLEPASLGWRWRWPTSAASTKRCRRRSRRARGPATCRRRFVGYIHGRAGRFRRGARGAACARRRAGPINLRAGHRHRARCRRPGRSRVRADVARSGLRRARALARGPASLHGVRAAARRAAVPGARRQAAPVRCRSRCAPLILDAPTPRAYGRKYAEGARRAPRGTHGANPRAQGANSADAGSGYRG